MGTLFLPEPPRSNLVEVPAANFALNPLGWTVVFVLWAGMITAIVTSVIGMIMVWNANGRPTPDDYAWVVGPLVLLAISLLVFFTVLRRERRIVAEARAVLGLVVHRQQRRRHVVLTYRYRDAGGQIYSAKAQGARSADAGDRIEVIFAASNPDISLPAQSFWFHTVPSVFPPDQLS